ncbi:uncharacterized protein [Drosophila suzukii]|uniref:Uncharacterized protein n=1 Tax=Drosophila suzukii TaxID=28584 RepID=A0ABM4TLE0_DROSZ
MAFKEYRVTTLFPADWFYRARIANAASGLCALARHKLFLLARCQARRKSNCLLRRNRNEMLQKILSDGGEEPSKSPKIMTTTKGQKKRRRNSKFFDRGQMPVEDLEINEAQKSDTFDRTPSVLSSDPRTVARSAQSAPENEWQNSSTVRLEDFDDIDYQDMMVNKDPQAKRLASK